MKLINTSRHAIRTAYAARRGAKTWGDNLLDKEVAPGGDAVVLVRSGCGTYSLRLVIDEKTEHDDLDLCADDDVVTVGPNGITRAHAAE